MCAARVYIGRIPYRTHEKDIERFFKGFGRIRDIMLKTGYCFVEFDNYRDADDAVYERNGRVLCGEKVVVEHARGVPHGEDLRKDIERGIDYPQRSRREFDRPRRRGEYRLIVENLSTRISWQDLKDLMRGAGEVTFADAHRDRRNEGLVEFASRREMERAMSKFDNMDLNGRRIRLFEANKRGKKRSSHSDRSASMERKKKRGEPHDAAATPSLINVEGGLKNDKKTSRDRSVEQNVSNSLKNNDLHGNDNNEESPRNGEHEGNLIVHI
ncbi:hypothetical protein HELRODRAFT_84222 [Helobdella robusta]|uniref:RRM domain-containing protein n=1 Tax=Helobdella robusta TaxID=6412 RepID=T1G5G0_HELRO|nr:hypothetical protein HELRODRAFT_84222 [Helobdella robusta]ESN99509.1 hypothetical protein HELRODRAFT_84222 [Helobdella robusta]